MTKSELIDTIATKYPLLLQKDVELSVKLILNTMATTLANGERIEIRGFGSSSLHHNKARRARNPKTGEAVAISGKYRAHFKPGKELKERVDNSFR